MKNRLFWVLMILLGLITPVTSGNAKEINFPARPSKSNIDIVTALEQRRTTREYSPAKLSLEDLSAILWAANGVIVRTASAPRRPPTVASTLTSTWPATMAFTCMMRPAIN